MGLGAPVPDVVVVGGGLLGSCVAYELVRSGRQVALVDRRDRGQATYAGAGILSPASSRWENETDAQFAYDAASYYETLVAHVEADGGGDTGYSAAEVMVIAGDGDDLVQFEDAKRAYSRFPDSRGVHPAMREISPQEATARFPLLGQVNGALLAERAARVDGSLLEAALLRAAVSRGLDVTHDGADSLVSTGGRVTGVSVRGEVTSCDSVVLATGAWSSQLLTGAGLRNCVRPMRGQICHLEWEGSVTHQWAVAVGLRGHYILPRSSGRVVVGATREADSGLDPDLTADGCYEVLHEALRLAPRLGAAHVAEWRIGLRPMSDDGRPILGPAPGLSGCYLATGHGAGGLLLGPWSAHLVVSQMGGDAVPVIGGPYGAARFAR